MEQAKIRYGCLPEYLWSDLPDAAVLRRTDTKKWIAVLMKVPRCKFGLQGDCPPEHILQLLSVSYSLAVK